MDLNTVVSILAIVSPIVSVGVIYGIISTKISYLEKKMDKHNCLIERMVVVEQSTKSAHHRIDELKE